MTCGPQQPPPPPMHRYPSWEDRIYQVASEGMKDVSTASGDQIDSKNNNGEAAAASGNAGLAETDLKGAGAYGSEVNVPVYATVKGVSGMAFFRVGHEFNILVRIFEIKS